MGYGMALNCETMKVGQVYACKSCGLELKIQKTCNRCGAEGSECDCKHEELCTFRCCGENLKLKTK